MVKPHLNIGDQSWRRAREALIVRCEKCGGTDFDEKEELGGTILTCKDCSRIIVNQAMLSADHDPCPLNGPIARNLGIQDGRNGTARRELLQSAFRCSYISGYISGSWERYTLRECHRRGYEGATYYLNDDSYRTIHDELFDLMFMPRYPHDPPLWYA